MGTVPDVSCKLLQPLLIVRLLCLCDAQVPDEACSVCSLCRDKYVMSDLGIEDRLQHTALLC